MRIPLDSPLLGNVPTRDFESYWPLDKPGEKLTELLTGEVGASAALQRIARSNWQSVQLVLMNKATAIGDLLASQLQSVSFFREVQGSSTLLGAFGPVDWSGFVSDPSQAFRAMVNAGIDVALNALTAVPIYNILARMFFSFTSQLMEIIDGLRQGRPVLMPWSGYEREVDEELTRVLVIDGYSKRVDQTNLFRPPWKANTAWHLGFAGDDNGLGRIVWAPWEGDRIPWSADNVGCMPGTMRIFGQVQLQRASTGSGPSNPAPHYYPGLPYPADKPNLRRITAQGAQIPWPPLVGNVGDYYPSASTTCGTMWNMIERPGSPDMYKVHVQTLLEEWAHAFESLEASFADLWSPGQANLVLGTAQIPWIAYRLRAQDPWRLGPPWRVPSYASWVTPDLYKTGAPGVPEFITDSLWIEEALSPDRSVDKDGYPLHPGWPYGREPRQHPCSLQGACSSTLGAMVTGSGLWSPAAWKDPKGPAPDGYRKVPWPTPEMRSAQYASPWTAIIRPTLERLRLQQERCLEATVVSAYVRHEAVGDLPAYGAFRDNHALAKRCHDVREILLKHPARWRVNLADVQAIDPKFAERLKVEGGLTGTPADWAKSLGLAAGGPVDGAPPPPPGEPPQGGLPFERFIPSPPPAGDSASSLAAILGTLAVGGLAVGGFAAARHLTKKRRRR